MPASIRVVTSSKMCVLLAANSPTPWPPTPAEPDYRESVSSPVGAVERFARCDQLIVGAARLRCASEHRIARVGKPRGAAARLDLGIELGHQQAVDQRCLIAELELLAAR